MVMITRIELSWTADFLFASEIMNRELILEELVRLDYFSRTIAKWPDPKALGS